MNIGVLGTGIVGQTMAARLAGLGHEVMIGTRDPAAALGRTEPDQYGNPPFPVWREQHPEIGLGTFALASPLQGLGVIKTWTAPTSNESVPITFKQSIAANEPLRTGTYSKTLTFTLSTTTP